MLRKLRLRQKKNGFLIKKNMYDTFENLATDWKKRDWMIVLDVLFATFFKNWYNISSHLKIFHILSSF